MSGDNSLSFVTHVIVVSVSNSPWLLRAEKKPGKGDEKSGKSKNVRVASGFLKIIFMKTFFHPEEINIL